MKITRTVVTKFPSPLGDLYFSIMATRKQMKTCISVSVPFRGSIFLNEKFNRIVEIMEISVPFRGAIFLNCNRTTTAFRTRNGFPSPFGELYFSIKRQKMQRLTVSPFPSPFGELYFSIRTGHGFNRWTIHVSVPFRGAIFLNQETNGCMCVH